MVTTNAGRNLRVGLARQYAGRQRVSRRPQCPFNVITKPFQIQPVMCHPVLPGETLRSLVLQSQVWSDPLAAGMKNIGWWCEYNVFYVRHRDLDIGTDGPVDFGGALRALFVADSALATLQDADGLAWTYCAPGGVDFTLACVGRVVDEYFRDEGEGAFDADKVIDGVPLAAIYGKGRSDVLERLTRATDYEDRSVAMPNFVGEQVEDAYADWAALYDAGVISMDYRDWMKAYGGGVTDAADPTQPNIIRPEDLAYFRQWTYPTNTVEPSTGAPSTAVGWRVAQQLKRPFAFDQPGWLLVTNTVRPKVYLENQQGLFAGMMQDRMSWLPPMLNDHSAVSHQLVGDDTGPLKAVMDAGDVDYWWDVRDLLNNGEQFINYTPAGPGFMELPTATAARRYAASTEIMEMFSNTETGRFRQDGMISLSILGRQEQQGRNLLLGSSAGA